MAEHHHGEHHPAEYMHGSMDIAEQQRTFEGFIRFWVIVFGATAIILIFLALVAT